MLVNGICKQEKDRRPQLVLLSSTLTQMSVLFLELYPAMNLPMVTESP